MEFGVNPNEASTAGAQTVASAEGMPNLAERFSNIMEAAADAAGDTGAAAGYITYNGDHKKGLQEIGRHGDQTGTNAQGVAGKGTSTDTDVGGGYRASSAALPSGPSITRSIN